MLWRKSLMLCSCTDAWWSLPLASSGTYLSSLQLYSVLWANWSGRKFSQPRRLDFESSPSFEISCSVWGPRLGIDLIFADSLPEFSTAGSWGLWLDTAQWLNECSRKKSYKHAIMKCCWGKRLHQRERMRWYNNAITHAPSFRCSLMELGVPVQDFGHWNHLPWLHFLP